MPRAVRFERYGGVDVLELVDVDPPQPGEGQLPVAASFPLERVRDAYTLLEHGHPPGKIVLVP